ncbi:MAG: hypothetical protein CM15mP74_37390 [Halieaceae bacterium]|nr:MAG: hypothetical protein CM15mP74_37390 [Halieaceae bacterium]
MKNRSNRVRCFHAGFAGADTHHLLKRCDEDLAIANLAGTGRRNNGFTIASTCSSGAAISSLSLGRKVYDVFSAAVQLGVARCRPKPLTSVTVTPCTPMSGKRGAHVIHLERFDNGCDQFHESIPLF